MHTRSRLTELERRSLDDDGYLVLPTMLNPVQVGRLQARLGALVRAAVAGGQGDDLEETGVVHAYIDIADADSAICHQHPLVRDAAANMLGEHWRLAELELRAPLPGHGLQGLHPDWEDQPATPGRWRSLSAMWCITAFTLHNGPLRVVPGSHRSPEPIDIPAMGPHPDEVRVLAPAGSLILFNNADLWHSGTLNSSPEPRLALKADFIAAQMST